MSKIFPCCPLSVISKGTASCNRDALPSLQMTFLTVVESLSAEKERETDRQRQRDRERQREGDSKIAHAKRSYVPRTDNPYDVWSALQIDIIIASFKSRNRQF